MWKNITNSMLVAITVSCVCSCGNKTGNNIQNDSTAVVASTDTAQTVTAKNEAPTLIMPCSYDEAMLAWNECFGDRGAKLKKYALYDVDKDGMPEVFLSNMDEKQQEEFGNCTAIFTCNDGKLHLVEQTYGITAGCSDYYIRINKKHDCIVYTHTNQGNSEIHILFFKNSRLAKALTKITEIHWVGEGENAIDTYTDKYYNNNILPGGSIDYLNRTEIKEEEISKYLDEKDILDLEKLGTEWKDYPYEQKEISQG